MKRKIKIKEQLLPKGSQDRVEKSELALATLWGMRAQTAKLDFCRVQLKS